MLCSSIITMTVFIMKSIYRQTEDVKFGYKQFNVVVALGMMLRSWICLYANE